MVQKEGESELLEGPNWSDRFATVGESFVEVGPGI